MLSTVDKECTVSRQPPAESNYVALFDNGSQDEQHQLARGREAYRVKMITRPMC